MPAFRIGADLADRFARDELRSDLAGTVGDRLHELGVTIDAMPSGETALSVTITAADLWTAVLTCMALLDHGRYDVTALRAHRQTTPLRGAAA